MKLLVVISSCKPGTLERFPGPRLVSSGNGPDCFPPQQLNHTHILSLFLLSRIQGSCWLNYAPESKRKYMSGTESHLSVHSLARNVEKQRRTVQPSYHSINTSRLSTQTLLLSSLCLSFSHARFLEPPSMPYRTERAPPNYCHNTP